MSTYMYLQCNDHNPPLCSADEVGQHHYDLPRIRNEIRNRTDIPVLDRWDTYGHMDSFTQNAVTFLRYHQDCNIGIVDEYGVEHPLEDDGDDE